MLRLQGFHCGLVPVVFFKKAFHKLKAMKIIKNQHILVIVLKIVGKYGLIDFQAFDERIVGIA